MKIAYFSNIFFTDSDFPLIREYQRKGIDVSYFINIYEGDLNGGLLSFPHLPQYGVTKANQYEVFRAYSKFLDLSNVYLITRTKKWYSYINFIIGIKVLLLILKNGYNKIHFTYELGLSECILYLFWHKSVMTIHDPFPHSGVISKYGEWKRKQAFKIIPQLILLNGNQKDSFIDYYHLHGKKILLNYLGVYNCNRYIWENSLKKNSNDSISGKYILFFGYFHHYKGIDILCEAMLEVHKILPDLKCVIAGGGELDFDYSKYENLDYIVMKRGFLQVEDLGNLISSSMFVVCPYRDATQSGVVVTTFAFGKPILSTRVGGMSESVLDNVTGRLIEPSNVSELSRTILEMASSENLLKSYSNNIENIYLDEDGKYSWSSIASKYLSFYNE